MKARVSKTDRGWLVVDPHPGRPFTWFATRLEADDYARACDLRLVWPGYSDWCVGDPARPDLARRFRTEGEARAYAERATPDGE